jgi:hypothetical protein
MQSKAKSDESKNKTNKQQKMENKTKRCEESSHATMQTYVIAKEESCPKMELYILK